MNGPIRALAVFGGRLYAGGDFGIADGNSALFIAGWSGSSWQAVGGGTSDHVMAMMPNGPELVVGGLFLSENGNTVNHLARRNGTYWGNYGGGQVTNVVSLANYHGRLVLGGDLHQSPTFGPATHEIAGWDGVQFSGFGIGMDGQVQALKSFKYTGLNGAYELVAGGSFTHAGGVTVNHIARWDESPFIAQSPVWQAMGAGFNDAVMAIERFSNVTYAGGVFTSSGVTTHFIAKWNTSTLAWDPVGTGMNGPVYVLKAYNGYLYAGGSFTSAGGVSTGGLARWNGTSWSACGGFFNGTVAALEVYNGVLAIGGTFPGINSSPNLAWYDGTSYGTFGIGGAGAAQDGVAALHALGTHLYAGGSFTTVDGVTANRIAYWDGSSWTQPAGGADNMVLALADFGGELDTGGLFTHVALGGLATPRCARYSESGLPWIAYQPQNAYATSTGTDSARFTVQPASGYSLTFQWYHYSAPLADSPAPYALAGTAAPLRARATPLADGATASGSIISGSHTNVLSIRGVSQDDYGPYLLVITDAFGHDTSATVTLSPPGTAGVGTPGGSGGVFEALGPNPASGPARLWFTLARAARVRVEVQDVAGRRVRELDLGRVVAGRHLAAWDAAGADGQRVRAGIYFVRLEADGRSLGVRRLSMLR